MIVLAFLRLALALLLSACGGGNGDTGAPANPDLALDASRWNFAYSPAMPVHPTQAGPALSFDFPSTDGAHELLTGYHGSLLGKDSITVSVSIVVDPATTWATAKNDPCTNVQMRVMVQKPDDKLTDQWGRYWSIVGIPLQTSTVTVTIPIDPEHWSDVYGQSGDKNPGIWENRFSNIENIGVSFGACSAAHGVWTPTGHASFTLAKFALE